jgi:Ca2+-binding RTX toxin-like protein
MTDASSTPSVFSSLGQSLTDEAASALFMGNAFKEFLPSMHQPMSDLSFAVEVHENGLHTQEVGLEAQIRAWHEWLEEQQSKNRLEDTSSIDPVTGSRPRVSTAPISGENEAEEPNPTAAASLQPPAIPLPVRIEGESMQLSGTYGVTTDTHSSGHQRIDIQRRSGDRGEAYTTFNGVDGTYAVIVGYYDEVDGESELSLRLGTQQFDWVADKNQTGGSPSQANIVRRVLSQAVVMKTGSEITLSGTRDRGELAAVDYIEFIPIDPTVPLPFRVEAEHMDLEGYRALEGRRYASNQSIVRPAGNTGHARFAFPKASGTYDIIVGYYDVPKHVAQYSLRVNGADYQWAGDANMKASPGTLPLVHRTIVQGVTLTKGEVIELVGHRHQTDKALIDYVEFVPSDERTPTGGNGVTVSGTMTEPTLDSAEIQSRVHEAQAQVQQRLAEFVASSRYGEQMSAVFGSAGASAFGRETLETLIHLDWSDLEIVVTPEIPTRGAYSTEFQRIYLAEVFVSGKETTTKVIARALVEEVGHYLDSVLNAEDTPGDEGERFAAAVYGVVLSAAEIDEINQEDDHRTVTINGITQQVEQASIDGTSGNDTLTGTTQADTIKAKGGNDIVDGRGGDDFIYGGPDDDYLYGGNGWDTIEGNAGDDRLYGQDGGDTLHLADHVEQLIQTGSDSITGYGNDLANYIRGNNANNALFGEGGDDVLIGNGGNDYLDGGTGADSLQGGPGNDVYVVDHGGDHVFELAGQGIDTVNASISYTLSNNVENLTLTGSASISGTGNSLNNTIIGNSGNNILDGGAGIDVLRGGSGNDVYRVDRSDDEVQEAVGGGIDTVESSAFYYSISDLYEIENLTLIGDAYQGNGNALNNTITGNARDNLLYGYEGNDILIGNGGNDSLSGGDGDDVINGGEGNDALFAGAGINTLIGGTGNDLYFIETDGNTLIEYADEGIDQVYSNVSHTLSEHIEVLVLQGTAASGTGNAEDNIIIGNASDNTLLGQGGNDTLRGGDGNDILQGASLSDADQATQIDVLEGGAGSDCFSIFCGESMSVNKVAGYWRGMRCGRSSTSSRAMPLS